MRSASGDPTKGSLHALNEEKLAIFRGSNVGIVFQSFHLIPTMTALENVAVPLELAGAHDALERAARDLAALVEELRVFAGTLTSMASLYPSGRETR